MNGKNMMNMDTSKEKERKEKEKKGHGPQDQGKGQGDGKGEANFVNPSHSSQPAAQQAALPSSATASGFFVTHSPVYLTSVKKTESGEQSMEPDFSGCAYVDKHDCGLCYKIEETSSRFFFANSQQSKCKVVIHMYDKAWNVRTTEFDIVEEGNVPLLMSLPQMRSLGIQFELSPQKSFLN